MRVEGDGGHGASSLRRSDDSEAASESENAHGRQARAAGRDRRSSVGELLHEANVKAAEEQAHKTPAKPGSLAALSDNLGSILGW
jgi:hypothetical protein